MKLCEVLDNRINVDIKDQELTGILADHKSTYGWGDSISGCFYCQRNQLTSLVGGPEIVEGDFYCYANQLTSLDGAPKSVGGHFHCSHNKLTSLEGAPSSIGGDFYVNNNQITSLKNIHLFVKKIDGNLIIFNNPIVSGLIDVLKIQKINVIVGSIKGSDLDKAIIIVNKQLKTDKDIVVCKRELISAGLKEFI